jgi:hypothetical protein
LLLLVGCLLWTSSESGFVSCHPSFGHISDNRFLHLCQSSCCQIPSWFLFAELHQSDQGGYHRLLHDSIRR